MIRTKYSISCKKWKNQNHFLSLSTVDKLTLRLDVIKLQWRPAWFFFPCEHLTPGRRWVESHRRAWISHLDKCSLCNQTGITYDKSCKWLQADMVMAAHGEEGSRDLILHVGRFSFLLMNEPWQRLSTNYWVWALETLTVKPGKGLSLSGIIIRSSTVNQGEGVCRQVSREQWFKPPCLLCPCLAAVIPSVTELMSVYNHIWINGIFQKSHLHINNCKGYCLALPTNH